MRKDKFWDDGITLVDGCTHKSPGCWNCWAEAIAARFKRVPEVLTDGKFNGKVQFNLHLLEKAAKVKRPHVYAIWNDLYHKGVTDEQIVKAFNIMDFATQHTFLIVTKRPQRAEDKGLVLPHVWHIVTMENQAMADKRMPHLLRIPGKRGVIVEPMLEWVDLTESVYCSWTEGMEMPYEEGYCRIGCDADDNDCDGMPSSLIHQVIFGPENGAGKRAYDPEWGEALKAQCEAAGVPCYDKANKTGQLAWRV